MGSYAFSNRKSTYQNQWCRSFLFCSSATNRLITSKDHASVQINVGHSDENGLYTGQFSTFALCGFVRAQVCRFFFQFYNKNIIL
ncbi:putative ribosomal protein S21e [Helianthus anomalus]